MCIAVEIGGCVFQSKQRELSTASCPLLDNSLKLREAIGQCGGPRLQNQGRFDFIEMLMLHRRNAVKARPRRDPLGSKLLSTPRKPCRGLPSLRHSEEDRFARESPLEGAGFERSVPCKGEPIITKCITSLPARRCWRADVGPRRREVVGRQIASSRPADPGAAETGVGAK